MSHPKQHCEEIRSRDPSKIPMHQPYKAKYDTSKSIKGTSSPSHEEPNHSEMIDPKSATPTRGMTRMYYVQSNTHIVRAQ